MWLVDTTRPLIMDGRLAICEAREADLKNYYRLMLGRKSSFADEAHKGNFVGVDCDIDRDLTGDLFENWRDFNRKFIPIYLEGHPDKTRVAAGLACGALWTVAKAFQLGDLVLCPDGTGTYLVGEVAGPYEYHPGRHPAPPPPGSVAPRRHPPSGNEPRA